ncbi:MAG: TIGR01906 family membrane protein [Gudongella sp.]|nr:TIGR01906 family membrane protein [Gudongella sp.]
MQKWNPIILIILIIAVSFLALVVAIEENTYNLDYYLESYEVNNIESITGKNKVELEIISKNIISFLKGNGDESLLADNFNDKEITHMEDVYDLYELARTIKLISAFLAIIIVLYYLSQTASKVMGKWLGLGLFANHILLIILAILVLTDFNKYFTIFHEIFFSNDLWLLDPKTDLLIQMLPESFFVNIAKNIGISFIKYLSFAQLIAYAFYKKGSYNIGRFKSPKRY